MSTGVPTKNSKTTRNNAKASCTPPTPVTPVGLPGSPTASELRAELARLARERPLLVAQYLLGNFDGLEPSGEVLVGTTRGHRAPGSAKGCHTGSHEHLISILAQTETGRRVAATVVEKAYEDVVGQGEFPEPVGQQRGADPVRGSWERAVARLLSVLT